jgi:predicted aspartyl protease
MPSHAAPHFAGLLLLAVTAMTAGIVRADPRIIGHTETKVRVIHAGQAGAGGGAGGGTTTGGDAATAGAGPDFGRAPDSTPPDAMALARAFVGAYGGPVALRAWLDHGSREGRQTVFAPAHVRLTYLERRQEGRARLDAHAGGIDVVLALLPDGGWQSELGLVSDLPDDQVEEMARERAHDESLLLDVLEGRAVARAVTVDAAPALCVYGPTGGTTRFLAGPGGPDQGPAAIAFEDRAQLRSDVVAQVARFDDWRELEPEKPGLSGPSGARVPFVDTHEIAGQLVLADSLDRVDLLADIPDSLFARPGSEELTVGPSRRTVLPMTAHEGHHFARVSIDGGPPRTFLVDTGAGMTAISAALADTLGLTLGEATSLIGLGGGIDGRSAMLRSVALGTLERRDVPCFVLDFSALHAVEGLDVEGILGFSVLNRYAVTFDFEHGALELAENAVRRAPAAGGTRVPMQMLGGEPIVDGRVDGGEPTSFIVDTGSPATFVPSDVGEAVARAGATAAPTEPFMGADGQPVIAQATRARSLAIGAARVARPALLYVKKGRSNDPIGLTLASGERGVIGADVLTRFTVTLDYPRKEFVLEPRRTQALETPR